MLALFSSGKKCPAVRCMPINSSQNASCSDPAASADFEIVDATGTSRHAVNRYAEQGSAVNLGGELSN